MLLAGQPSMPYPAHGIRDKDFQYTVQLCNRASLGLSKNLLRKEERILCCGIHKCLTLAPLSRMLRTLRTGKLFQNLIFPERVTIASIHWAAPAPRGSWYQVVGSVRLLCATFLKRRSRRIGHLPLIHIILSGFSPEKKCTIVCRSPAMIDAHSTAAPWSAIAISNPIIST